MFKVKFTVSLLLLSLSLWLSATAYAQGTAFTYQGKLTDSGNLANGNYDLQFKLFDTVTVGTGTQQGGIVAVSNVSVSNGIFTVQLDFGACPTCFNGAARFLEIAVKPTSGGSFTTLGPRQPITSSPYAINASQLGGLAASGFLQNSTSQQASSNFNVSGDGTAGGTLSANFINAATRFNLGGQQVLSAAGLSNLFAGISAGTSNTTGSSNAFFGSQAGNANTTGFSNSFFGADAGSSNATGIRNTFIGRNANFNASNSSGGGNTLLGAFSSVTSGKSNATAIGLRALVEQSNSLVLGAINTVNGCDPADGCNTVNVGIGTTTPQFRLDVVGDINTTTGYNFGGQRVLGVDASNNLFAGFSAGTSNTTGHDNAYFGAGAGNANTTGNFNAFFGQGAGFNTTNGGNAFFGADAGGNNTTGCCNTFLGIFAGEFNTTGFNNTMIGYNAQAGVNTLTNATAIGAYAQVGQNNSLVLGSINGINNATADTKVGIGTTAPNKHLHVAGAGDQEIMIESTDANGRQWTLQSSQGANNGRFEIIDRTANSGRLAILNSGNVGIGTSAPENRLQVVGAIQSTGARTAAPSGNAVTLSSESTFDALQSWASRPLALNGLGNNVGIGTTAPADKLDVSGDVRVGTSGTNGCLKNNNGGTIIGTCSSDARFKRAITPFPNLLSRIIQLQPVHFYWRTDQFPNHHFGQAREAGLIAQEVEKVLPELVTEDEQGYKAVNYSKLPLLSIQAIKELKAENDQLKQQLTEQQQQIREQQQEMAAVKNLLCQSQPQADLCKAKSLK